MKTKEELNALKAEVETLNKKLGELTEDELLQVVGGDVTSANIVGYCTRLSKSQQSTDKKITKVPGDSSWQYFD